MIYASAVLIDEGRSARMKHDLKEEASHFDFMRHFMREMSRMFEGFPGAGGSNHSLTSWPPIEVTEHDNRVVRGTVDARNREPSARP